MKKIINYFELNRPYQFDITDITCLIYTACVVGIMAGYNMNILFCIGSAISTAFCWKAKRLNLILLNGSLFILNVWYVIQMFTP